MDNELQCRITRAAVTYFHCQSWQIDAIYSDGEWYLYLADVAAGTTGEPELIKYKAIENDGFADGFAFELTEM